MFAWIGSLAIARLFAFCSFSAFTHCAGVNPSPLAMIPPFGYAVEAFRFGR
jgi:hypothetical protein